MSNWIFGRSVMAGLAVLLVMGGCASHPSSEFQGVSPSLRQPAQTVAEADLLIDEGISLFALGNLDESLEVWKLALAAKKNDARLRNFIGVALVKQEKYQEALDWFNEALRLKPDFSEAFNNYGYAAFKLGEYDTAIEYYGQALKLNPNYPEAQRNLQTALEVVSKHLSLHSYELVIEAEKTEDLERRVSLYRQAIDLNPDYAPAYNNLAVALYYLGKHEEVIEALQKALELNPDFVEAHNNVANVYQDQGDYEKALSHYIKAVELEPLYVVGYENLAYCLAEVKDYAKALAAWEVVLDLDPGNRRAARNIRRYKALLTSEESVSP